MDIVSQFLAQVSASSREFYGRRDNCGPACIDFIAWTESYLNLKLTRVYGHFKADFVVSDKDDFTSAMRKEFLKSHSLAEFDNPDSRKLFIESSPRYSEDWKLIPHYWTEDSQGNIFDVTGLVQFVSTGLSADLKSFRYLRIINEHPRLYAG